MYLFFILSRHWYTLLTSRLIPFTMGNLSCLYDSANNDSANNDSAKKKKKKGTKMYAQAPLETLQVARLITINPDEDTYIPVAPVELETLQVARVIETKETKEQTKELLRLIQRLNTQKIREDKSDKSYAISYINILFDEAMNKAQKMKRK